MNFKKIVAFGAPPIVTLVIGGVFGFAYAKQMLQEEFDTRLEDEREELRRYYTRKYKRGDLETAEKAAETLTEKKTFKGPRSGVDIPEGPPYEGPSEESREALALAVKKLRYDDTPIEPEEPWVANAAAQEGLEDKSPKVISVEEFLANEVDHYQPTWKYYESDDILVDDAGHVIHDRDDVIGAGSLKCFGQGSNSIDLVYVRNHDLERDYEIVREHTAYAKRNQDEDDAVEARVEKKQRHGNRSR